MFTSPSRTLSSSLVFEIPMTAALVFWAVKRSFSILDKRPFTFKWRKCKPLLLKFYHISVSVKCSSKFTSDVFNSSEEGSVNEESAKGSWSE